MKASSDSRIGTWIAGKWQLEQILGRGGMATVYAATHCNGSRVAIKILRREFANDTDAARRFTREGYVGNSVGHPGAVVTIDDGVLPEGTPYLVMERLDGENLSEKLARTPGKRLDRQEAVRIILCVLDILAAAHGRGIVHRDIKPANIFVTNSGQVKLLDFGIARDGANTHQRTRAGLVFGTPSFMSPEQAKGDIESIDATSDLWAAGATLFTMLTGRNVHTGDSPAVTLVKAMRPAQPVAILAPELPPALRTFFDFALAYDKPGRFASAAAMQQALYKATVPATGVQQPLPMQPLPMQSRPSYPLRGSYAPGAKAAERPMPPWRIVAIGAFSLVVVAIVALAIWASESTPRHSMIPLTSARAEPTPSSEPAPVASPDVPPPALVPSDEPPQPAASAPPPRLASPRRRPR